MCELDTEILTFTDQEKSCLYYYLDSEAILLTFELIVIVSLKTLSVSVRCMSHLKIKYIIITIICVSIEGANSHSVNCHDTWKPCRETSLSQIVVDNQVLKPHRILGFIYYCQLVHFGKKACTLKYTIFREFDLGLLCLNRSRLGGVIMLIHDSLVPQVVVSGPNDLVHSEFE